MKTFEWHETRLRPPRRTRWRNGSLHAAFIDEGCMKASCDEGCMQASSTKASSMKAAWRLHRDEAFIDEGNLHRWRLHRWRFPSSVEPSTPRNLINPMENLIPGNLHRTDRSLQWWRLCRSSLHRDEAFMQPSSMKPACSLHRWSLHAAFIAMKPSCSLHGWRLHQVFILHLHRGGVPCAF